MAPPARFLQAEWRSLAMLNYEVDPAALKRRVPAGTELDAWQGRTLVSVVGFLFLRTRVLGVPVPGHRDFEEVNLRFYVRRRAEEGWRRGVVFVKELVPRRAIAWVANRVYGERYRALPMRHDVSLPDGPGGSGRVSYGWRLGSRWMGLEARVRGTPAVAPDGSEEQFVTEHYWGYAAQRDGSSLEYQVEHPPWRVWAAEDCALDADVAALYGAEFAEPLAAAPTSAFVADGSAVCVRRGTPLR